MLNGSDVAKATSNPLNLFHLSN